MAIWRFGDLAELPVSPYPAAWENHSLAIPGSCLAPIMGWIPAIAPVSALMANRMIHPVDGHFQRPSTRQLDSTVSISRSA
jgi:hypothetical protein